MKKMNETEINYESYKFIQGQKDALGEKIINCLDSKAHLVEYCQVETFIGSKNAPDGEFFKITIRTNRMGGNMERVFFLHPKLMGMVYTHVYTCTYEMEEEYPLHEDRDYAIFEEEGYGFSLFRRYPTIEKALESWMKEVHDKGPGFQVYDGDWGTVMPLLSI